LLRHAARAVNTAKQAAEKRYFERFAPLRAGLRQRGSLFFCDFKDNQITCDILIESRVKPDVLQALRDKGHKLMVRKEYTSLMGRGQAVLHNSKTGMNFGASDPRADGTAEPEPLPQNP